MFEGFCDYCEQAADDCTEGWGQSVVCGRCRGDRPRRKARLNRLAVTS